MENLNIYDNSQMETALNNIFSRRKAPAGDSVGVDGAENGLSFSWQDYIDEQKLISNSNVTESLRNEDSLESRDEGSSVTSLSKWEEKLNDEFSEKAGTVCVVDGAAIGDVPTFYTIKGLQPYELPVKGTFVHPRIIPGFSYVVRPINTQKALFNGKARCLQRVGMGYGKRLTFASEQLRENENYFWSDSNPEGFAFSIELVHEGDTFKVVDETDNTVAVLTVNRTMGPQKETDESVSSDNKLEKQVDVTMHCKVNYLADVEMVYDDCVTVSGIAVALKKPKSRSPASVVKVKNCYINGERFTLIPTSSFKGITKNLTLSGSDVCDIPTTYSVSGVYPDELPVIGTFVDPRIIPGFKYKVRLLDSKKHLFGGEALTLKSIGRGYGKRITFEGDSLKENDNYFWSDTHPAGFGFTLRGISEKDSFAIIDKNGLKMGTVEVFKICGPQKELESYTKGKVSTKKVSVSVACHLLMADKMDHFTTRVGGTAFVSARRGEKSVVTRIEDLKFLHLFNSDFDSTRVAAFVTHF